MQNRLNEKKQYMLDDDAACELWESLGMFVRPEMQEGDDNITSVILKTIVDDAQPTSSPKHKPDITFEEFLSVLDKAFSLGTSLDLYEAHDYVGAYDVWSELVDQDYFDPRDPQIADKPYYRAVVTSAICQSILACIHVINSGQVSKTDDGFASELKTWVERVLDLCIRISEVQPLEVGESGYFKQNREGVSAQNHNVWMCLKTLSEWFNGWSPRVISSFSEMKQTEIEQIVRLVRQQEGVFRSSDK